MHIENCVIISMNSKSLNFFQQILICFCYADFSARTRDTIIPASRATVATVANLPQARPVINCLLGVAPNPLVLDKMSRTAARCAYWLRHVVSLHFLFLGPAEALTYIA